MSGDIYYTLRDQFLLIQKKLYTV